MDYRLTGEATLLSKQQLDNGQVRPLRTLGIDCAITDFAVLLGGIPHQDHLPWDDSPKGRRTDYYLSSHGLDISGQYEDAIWKHKILAISPCVRNLSIRPVLPITDVSDSFTFNWESHPIKKVTYGEYPQWVVSEEMEKELNTAYSRRLLTKTGKTYTTDSCRIEWGDNKFKPRSHIEYEYKGKKYVRIKPTGGSYSSLSSGENIRSNKFYWVEVSPVTWFIDPILKILVSEYAIAAGVRICEENNIPNDFKLTEMYSFLNNYLVKDLEPGKVVKEVHNDSVSKKFNKKEINPYGLKFKEVSEEDIIKGAIETGVAVFLHGPSSEGKSARIKAIDPDCKIIYLRNASPDSLNGKSVYNEQTGEMIDVKPTWLKQLEEKCEKEPDKLHIVFFDEITNALPSIQGIAFNIVLDREVNGMWKLPENARIVAAGNDMKDSLAANQLAEPLYNRFAHVFIKTTTMGWLKWASEHNIHPAIYSFIAYKKGSVLRSEYTGDKPNADPRKWEMASNMLYKTENPNMLRALVGEDITKEFVQFCKQKVITLEDVLTHNYDLEEVAKFNIAESYATVMGLSMVGEDNIEVVRYFVTFLGSEVTAVFDAMWSHGDESRLEKIAELKLKDEEQMNQLLTAQSIMDHSMSL